MSEFRLKRKKEFVFDRIIRFGIILYRIYYDKWNDILVNRINIPRMELDRLLSEIAGLKFKLELSWKRVKEGI